MTWFDKLFFISLSMMTIGGIGCVIAFGAMILERKH